MMRWLFLILFSLLQIALVFGQGVEWIGWEELNAKMQVQPKKIIVSFNKANCTWCKEMENKSMGGEDIASYINQTFYPLKLSVHEDRSIVVNEKTFRKDRDGIHQLAKILSRNQISFPMIVFVNEQFQVIQPIAGIHSTDKLRDILVYFGEDYFQEIPWKRFIKEYKDTNQGAGNSVLIKGR